MLKITRINIKNFRSFRNCTFELKDLQLLIGPNNSGKTNLLKAFEFLREVTNPDTVVDIDLNKIRFQHKDYHEEKPTNDKLRFPDPVEITVEFKDDADIGAFYYYKIELYIVGKRGTSNNTTSSLHNEFIGMRRDKIEDKEFSNLTLSDLKRIRQQFLISALNRNNTIFLSEELLKNQIEGNDSSINTTYQLYITKESIKVNNPNFSLGYFLSKSSLNDRLLDFIKTDMWIIFKQLIIYKPDTSYIKYAVSTFAKPVSINGDGSNIVSYLEGLLSSDPDRFMTINHELEKCIPEFKGYNFDTINAGVDDDGVVQTERVLRLRDKYGIDHLAEDISEGTLYFLMLFAIISQKNIPPVLMLEEPETNIHPRRISEIMEYIFKLREQYPNISIILTTHHPYVVDHFKNMTDRVWIFDTENGETKIKNLERDIINPSNKELKKAEMEPIDYSSSLGEHWAMGFLGGVPKPVTR